MGCASSEPLAADKEAVRFEKVANVFVGTWNVGNAEPSADLTSWLQKKDSANVPFDIYVIGVQECDYKPKKGACAAHFIKRVHETVGGEYEIVKYHSLMQMRIAVLAKAPIAKQITNINVSREATGIGGVIGNKGGVVTTFDLADTRMAFINSHLAAHQNKTEKRNEDVAEVLQGVAIGKGKVDLLHQYHHVVWMGDLNYRLNFGKSAEAKEPSEEDFNAMVGMIEAKQYDELFALDQLAAARAKGEVFHGFREGEYKFPPTFKVLRNEKTFKYKNQRSPAWCDRILWKSMPNVKPMELTKLNAAAEVDSSDHKPVYAHFKLPFFKHLPAKAQGQALYTLHITELRGHGLPIADVKSSDPYVQITYPGTAKVIKGGKVKTPYKASTLDPVWLDKEVPPVELLISNPDRLRETTLSVGVWDYDTASGDDILGFANFHLGEYLNKGKVPFDLVLRRYNLPAGRLTGVVELAQK